MGKMRCIKKDLAGSALIAQGRQFPPPFWQRKCPAFILPGRVLELTTGVPSGPILQEHA